MALVFTGSYVIPVERERVWAGLNDTAVLARCIPGCSALAMSGPNTFAATIVARIGVISATFKGELERSEMEPPRRYVLAGRANGGLAGFASGRAEVVLDEDDSSGRTTLTYRADADIGGKVAMVGGRLIESVARSLADDFFGAFSREVAGADATRAENAGLGQEMPPAAAESMAQALPAVRPTASLSLARETAVPVRVLGAFFAGIGVGIVATAAAAVALGLAH